MSDPWSEQTIGDRPIQEGASVGGVPGAGVPLGDVPPRPDTTAPTIAGPAHTAVGAAAIGSPVDRAGPESELGRPERRLPLPLHVTASLVGEYRWIESSLYRLLGEWVVDVPVAGVRVHLDGQSMRHAWHAELWGDRLPVRDGMDPEAFTVPSAPTAALFAALADSFGRPEVPTVSWLPEGGEPAPLGVLPRLAALYRVVLPRLVTTYELHLAGTTVATDGPVARALTLVLNDERGDWMAGEQLLERLVTRPHDVAACYEFLQRLESVLVATGAGPGLLSLPSGLSEG
ncbi:MAG: hypothetical protein ACYDES_12285 [Acidimicrobiales bacterium]